MAEEKKPGDQNSPSFIETARRAQIIECTIEAIAEVGYARTSLAEIARRAGISKGVILYYFHSKKELLEQVISEIYTSGAHFMGPQIAAQPTAARMLQAYIRTDLEYIGTHRLQMMAIVEIVTHYRTKYGDLSYNAVTEEPILQAVESILRKGQQEGEFRSFDLRVMAITIRYSIDAAAYLLATNPDLDVNSYAQELVTLFDRATRKDEDESS